MRERYMRIPIILAMLQRSISVMIRTAWREHYHDSYVSYEDESLIDALFDLRVLSARCATRWGTRPRRRPTTPNSA